MEKTRANMKNKLPQSLSMQMHLNHNLQMSPTNQKKHGNQQEKSQPPPPIMPRVTGHHRSRAMINNDSQAEQLMADGQRTDQQRNNLNESLITNNSNKNEKHLLKNYYHQGGQKDVLANFLKKYETEVMNTQNIVVSKKRDGENSSMPRAKHNTRKSNHSINSGIIWANEPFYGALNGSVKKIPNVKNEGVDTRKAYQLDFKSKGDEIPYLYHRDTDHSSLTISEFDNEIHLRGKPGITDNIPNIFKQKQYKRGLKTEKVSDYKNMAKNYQCKEMGENSVNRKKYQRIVGNDISSATCVPTSSRINQVSRQSNHSNIGATDPAQIRFQQRVKHDYYKERRTSQTLQTDSYRQRHTLILRPQDIHSKIGIQIQKQKNLRRNIQYPSKKDADGSGVLSRRNPISEPMSCERESAREMSFKNGLSRGQYQSVHDDNNYQSSHSNKNHSALDSHDVLIENSGERVPPLLAVPQQTPPEADEPFYDYDIDIANIEAAHHIQKQPQIQYMAIGSKQINKNVEQPGSPTKDLQCQIINRDQELYQEVKDEKSTDRKGQARNRVKQRQNRGIKKEEISENVTQRNQSCSHSREVQVRPNKNIIKVKKRHVIEKKFHQSMDTDALALQKQMIEPAEDARAKKGLKSRELQRRKHNASLVGRPDRGSQPSAYQQDTMGMQDDLINLQKERIYLQINLINQLKNREKLIESGSAAPSLIEKPDLPEKFGQSLNVHLTDVKNYKQSKAYKKLQSEQDEGRVGSLINNRLIGSEVILDDQSVDADGNVGPRNFMTIQQINKDHFFQQKLAKNNLRKSLGPLKNQREMVQKLNGKKIQNIHDYIVGVEINTKNNRAAYLSAEKKLVSPKRHLQNQIRPEMEENSSKQPCVQNPCSIISNLGDSIEELQNFSPRKTVNQPDPKINEMRSNIFLEQTNELTTSKKKMQTQQDFIRSNIQSVQRPLLPNAIDSSRVKVSSRIVKQQAEIATRVEKDKKENNSESSSMASLIHQVNGAPLIDGQGTVSKPIQNPSPYSDLQKKELNNKSLCSRAYNKHQNQTIGAVPHAINTGGKYMVFRAFTGKDMKRLDTSNHRKRNSSSMNVDGQEGQNQTSSTPKSQAVDKGYYYKFNSNNEIKLVKYTLEDNGFFPLPNKVLRQMVASYQMMNQGRGSEIRRCNEISDWLIMWTTKVLKNAEFNKLQKYQKVNQFPRSNEITRKDYLIQRIQRMQELHGHRNFDFLPKSRILPKELDQLQVEMQANPMQWWIVKPSQSSQGKGIFITKDFKDVAQYRGCSMIASHYIDNPLLIDGLKSDLRIYVALTSISPLRIYMYEEGLTRFATTPYVPPYDQDNINKKEGKYIHLTNYSINKFNKKAFVQNSNPDDDIQGSKWSLRGFRKVLRANDIDDKVIFNKIKDIIIKTFISAESIMKSAYQINLPTRNNCFQLFGFDIMIDNKLNPWLLEVNLSPSLACDSPLDQKIKGSMLSDLLNLASIQSFDHNNQSGQQKQGSRLQGDSWSNQGQSTKRSHQRNAASTALGMTNLTEQVNEQDESNEVQTDQIKRESSFQIQKSQTVWAKKKGKAKGGRLSNLRKRPVQVSLEASLEKVSTDAKINPSESGNTRIMAEGSLAGHVRQSSTHVPQYQPMTGAQHPRESVYNNMVYGGISAYSLNYTSAQSYLKAHQLNQRNVEQILRESEMEFKRKGQFQLIFPGHQSSFCLYKNLFEETGRDNINYWLHQRFLEKGIFVQQKKEEEMREKAYFDSQRAFYQQQQQQQQQTDENS